MRSLTCQTRLGQRGSHPWVNSMRHAFGGHQGAILIGQEAFGRGQDALKIGGEGGQLDADRQRPAARGSGPDGLAIWKAPEATNRIWSVRPCACLVLTVGLRPAAAGRAEPSRRRPGPRFAALADLVDLVEETIPWFSTAVTASSFTSSG